MILTQPYTLSDLNTPQWFRVSATNSTETNYLYTFDVQTISYTGSVIETIGRYKLPNRPDGTCLFSPHKILKSQIEYGVGPDNSITTLNGFTQSQDMKVDYRLRIGEEFNISVTFSSTSDTGGYLTLGLSNASDLSKFRIGDIIYINKNNKSVNLSYDGTASVTATASSALVTDTAWTGVILTNESGTIESITRYTENSGTYSAIPMLREYTDFLTNIGTSYLMATSSVGNFLSLNAHSSFSTAKNIYPYQYESLSLITSPGITASSMEIVLYTSSQSIIATYSKSNTISQYNRFDIGSGTANIAFTTGAIPATCVYYSIRIKNNNSYISNPFYYKINYCIPTSDLIFGIWFGPKLCYLNSRGGYSHIDFPKMSSYVDTVERKQFTKNLDYDYSLGDRGDTIYDVNLDRVYTINTDWLTDSDNEDIAELLKSTDVYLNYAGGLSPIVIQTNSVSYKKQSNFEMAQYTITYKLAYKNNTNSL